MSGEAGSLVTAETVAEGVVRLRLERPRAYNALSRALMGELGAALRAIADDGTTRAIVLCGSGPGFSAGHDLKEIRGIDDEAELLALFEQCSALMTRVTECPVPVIAAVHGVATAAGCQLVASCDLAVAAASARFATPGVNIGLFCATPAVALSRSVARKHALEMLLTGEFADAQMAQRIGLVNRVVPDGEEVDAALALAERIATRAAGAVRTGKALFARQLDLPVERAYAEASAAMASALVGAEARRGVGDFVAGTETDWRD